MTTNSSRFDVLARYYPAVYSFAARLTDDPREAVALTQQASIARENNYTECAPDRDRDGPHRCSSACRIGIRLICFRDFSFGFGRLAVIAA
jgi:hypothetical protein